MHRFRFFIEVDAAADAVVALDPVDAEHVRVLRLAAGTSVEVVDATGTAWDALVEDRQHVRLQAARVGEEHEPRIELVAGSLVGGRFDELVDAAVQGGATTVIPLALQQRDAQRLAARRDRLQRIARSAAKQSKRQLVPVVSEPIDAAALLALEPGIVLDPDADVLLDEAVRAARGVRCLRLLVGPAEGLPGALVQQLRDAGWQAGRLGPSILRAELAAGVAVAIAAMHALPVSHRSS